MIRCLLIGPRILVAREAIPSAELLGSSHSWIKATVMDFFGDRREKESPSATEAADKLVRSHGMQPGGFPLRCEVIEGSELVITSVKVLLEELWSG